MYDLENCTFILPARVNEKDRFENFKLIIEYIRKYFITNILVVECDKQSYLDKLVYTTYNTNEKYIFISDESEDELFNKSKILNVALKNIQTEYIIFYDIDIIANVNDIYDGYTKVVKNNNIIFVPHNRKFYKVSRIYFKDMQENLNYDLLYNAKNGIKYIDFRNPKNSNFTGCVFISTLKSILSVGGFNETMNGWGWEDEEIYNRLNRFGFVFKYSNNPVFHINHKIYNRYISLLNDNINSSLLKSEMEKNKHKCKNSKTNPIQSLINYILEWPWITRDCFRFMKNYKKKIVLDTIKEKNNIELKNDKIYTESIDNVKQSHLIINDDEPINDNYIFDFIIPIFEIDNSFDYRLRSLDIILKLIPNNVHVILVELFEFENEQRKLKRIEWLRNIDLYKNITYVDIYYDGKFNKSWMYNVGYKYALTNKLLFGESECYTFDPCYFDNLYTFVESYNLHFCMGWNRIKYIDKDNHTLEIDKFFKRGSTEGGIVYFRKKFFEMIYGYNEFIELLGGMDNEINNRAYYYIHDIPLFESTLYHLWHPRETKNEIRKQNIKVINGSISKSSFKNPDKVINILSRYKIGGDRPLPFYNKKTIHELLELNN